jgi:hypothetical protein
VRGAAREPSRVLLEHLHRRLGAHVHELASAADEPASPSDGLLWATSVDLAALIPVIEELLDREIFPTNSAPVANERAATPNSKQ